MKRLAKEVARECRLFQSIKTVAERSHLHWETVKEIDKDALGRELDRQISVGYGNWP